tara:strand:- start:6526 stop:7251 length:726 start_codon:yes stop_codon:yes gene_type:complete
MNTTVQSLQRRLTALGYDAGPADGISGPKTTAAVKAFQTALGLVVDGIAGPQTMAALRQAETPAKPRRPEPNKGAMAQPVPASEDYGRASPLPNVGSLKLLDTARPIDEIIWHCTATPEGKDFTVADIRAWHKQRGWSDIGYHYVVYRDGRIMLGRPVGQVGAHVAGHNTGTIGCSYVGGVSADGKRAKDTRTAAQRASMLWLTEQLVKKFKITKISGHCAYAAKACPSFDVRKDALSRLL